MKQVGDGERVSELRGFILNSHRGAVGTLKHASPYISEINHKCSEEEEGNI